MEPIFHAFVQHHHPDDEERRTAWSLANNIRGRGTNARTLENRGELRRTGPFQGQRPEHPCYPTTTRNSSCTRIIVNQPAKNSLQPLRPNTRRNFFTEASEPCRVTNRSL